MRILFLTHSFNSLSQRLFVALREAGHEVSVEFDINDQVSLDAVQRYQPDLVIAPFLKRAIPAAIWRHHRCLIVHPGIAGDRGPSALDWAIMDGESSWGVTVLEANEVMDGGDIWSTREFAMRDATKASLYRHEVARCAVAAVLEAMDRIASGSALPTPQTALDAAHCGTERPAMPQAGRRIDWSGDTTGTVLRKIRSADGVPGVRDQLYERDVYLYDARPEGVWRGTPGQLLARCGPAVCRATVDGAVWIGQLRDPHSVHPFKRPATDVLGELVCDLPEVVATAKTGYRDIWYEQHGAVGVLYFEFYNGAMGTTQCERLRAAYRNACQQDTRVVVLAGGADFWSNGMHLNQIEASASAADASWANINAINDLARDIIETTSHLTVAALRGNAGAGGVFLARACDEVWAHADVVLNPHYKDMGNLYGSEYWTYLFPHCVSRARATDITEARLPMGCHEGIELGLIDHCISDHSDQCLAQAKQRALNFAEDNGFGERLAHKRARRMAHERKRPLQAYRDAELKRMRQNFFGFDPSYHVARYNFVYKVPKSRTPLTIATHRRTTAPEASQRAVL